jgi:hypothetical protein
MVGVDSALHASIGLWGLTLLGPKSALRGVEIRPSRSVISIQKAPPSLVNMMSSGDHCRSLLAGDSEVTIACKQAPTICMDSVQAGTPIEATCPLFTIEGEAGEKRVGGTRANINSDSTPSDGGVGQNPMAPLAPARHDRLNPARSTASCSDHLAIRSDQTPQSANIESSP